MKKILWESSNYYAINPTRLRKKMVYFLEDGTKVMTIDIQKRVVTVIVKSINYSNPSIYSIGDMIKVPKKRLREYVMKTPEETKEYWKQEQKRIDKEDVKRKKSDKEFKVAYDKSDTLHGASCRLNKSLDELKAELKKSWREFVNDLKAWKNKYIDRGGIVDRSIDKKGK